MTFCELDPLTLLNFVIEKRDDPYFGGRRSVEYRRIKYRMYEYRFGLDKTLKPNKNKTLQSIIEKTKE